ncbi:hypothetical protein [Yersinia massiliensis]|uniref:hypothetical protein n=1 Tax=Yersinia massiliensis TaxID=419257 RepID=UPI0025AB361C|nr:hypothetical protein [Yersinia massiliensis]MDN0128345.1 hypothetical protein [Yersinia massiliensis]
MNKVDNPCTDQALTDVLSDIAVYLEAAQRLTQDPGQGVQLADCIISYCADYAKTMAGRAALEGTYHEI